MLEDANSVLDQALVMRARREQISKHNGVILCFNFHSGAEKSTLVHAVEAWV